VAEGELMKIHITELQIGDRLVSNVFNSFGLHVLSTDTVLDADDIGKLFRHHIDYVDIQMRSNFDEAPRSNPEIESIILKVQPKFDSAVTGMKDLFEQVMADGKIDERIVQQNFDPLIEKFQQEKDVVSLLLTLTSKDDYTYQHCVQVGMISYYIAKWIGLSERDAFVVGKAGYLHDIGKSRIDSKILLKPSKLTDAEYEEMKHHTTLGYEIISRSAMDGNELKLVALQHHERLDGRGYPNHITGDRMHPFSKIVAVADVYSAMISSRIYQKKRDLLYVLRELHRLSFAELDPQVTHAFIQRMIPNFIGKKLVLTSGEIADIVMTNPTDVFRPLIRIHNEFIDLSKNHHLEVDTIYL
jgi:putative nucleotidyltransferase with HDIG domain